MKKVEVQEFKNNKIRRRDLIIGVPTALLMSGCVSRSSKCLQSDLVKQALCRQQSVESATITNVTAGIIIGAALGAGFAYAVGGDPLVGAMAGSLIGGGAAAAKQYLDYKIAQSNYQQAVALSQIKEDIKIDIEYAWQALRDIRIAKKEIEIAFSKKNNQLIKATQRAEESKVLLNQININTNTFEKAYFIYDEVIDITALKEDREARERILKLNMAAQKIREEEHKTALLMEYGELVQ